MQEDSIRSRWTESEEPLRRDPASDNALPAANPAAPSPVNSGTDGALEDDRRSGPRYRSVMRAARVASTVHNVETIGLVRNISEGGMLVHSYAAFETGDTVKISVLDGEGIEGVVVWQDEGAIGIKFNDWISVEAVLNRAPQGGARNPRPPRIGLDKAISIRVDTYLADATIRDISQRGAKLQFNSFLPIDCRVLISRGGLRPVSGSVKWQAGNIVGIEFHRTLALEELAGWTGNA